MASLLLGNPLYAALLATFFQYGVAMHDLEAERFATGEQAPKEKQDKMGAIWRKVKGQTLKDYVLSRCCRAPRSRW